MGNPAAVSLLNGNTATTEEPPIHVMYVDDEVGLLKAAKPILEMQGSFRVETALSVEEAMEKMEAKAFDVIVSDYIMPGKDGLEFLRELRESGNNIPFIVFTGKGREIVAIKALNLGADQYVNKIGNPETVYSELAHGIRAVVKRKKAEKALQESEEKYRTMIEQAPDLILTVDKKGIVTSCNAVLEKNTDFSQNEVVGKHFLETPLLHGIPPETSQRVFNSILEGKSPERIEIKWFLKDGTSRISELRIGLNKKDDKIAGFTAVARDITEHKKAEEKLHESEEKFRNLAEKSPNMIFINKKGRVVYANKRCEEVMGYSREEFYSPDFDFFVLVAPESIELQKSSYSRHLKGEEIRPYEYTLLTKEGKRIEAILTSKLITYEGEPAILGIITDISERKQIEKQLKASEAKHRNLVELSPDGMISLDINGIVTSVNQAILIQTGFSEKDFLGKHFTQLAAIPPANLSELTKKINSFLRGATPDVFELVYCCKDGTQLVAEASTGLLQENGESYGLQLIFRDVTERKKAEAALKDSEKKFRTIFEGSTNGIAALDPKTMKVIFANPKLAEITGYPLDELLNSTITDFVPKNQLSLIIQQFQNHVKGKTDVTRHIPVVRKDGTLIYCDVRSNFLNIGNQQHLMTFIRDITAQKNAEEALRKSEENYRETIVNSNVGIICHNPEGEVKLINPKMEQMTGFKISEIPTLHDWFEKVYPNEEERRKIRAKWFKRMSEEGEVKEGHSIITTKDGQRRNLLFNAVRLQSGDSIAFAIDITESIAAWESLDETINALMTINEKLNVVGRLTRHDVRNKLSVIANNVYLAKQKLTANHSALEYLGDIESAIGQVEKIFGFSRNYEMLGVEELSCIDVEKNVDEAAMMFSGLSTVKLVNECKGLTVMADSLLRQLFYNLIDNTLKYGEKVSRIRVYYEEEAEQLKLVYEDDGVGIPEKEKEKIFRDEYGKGTGYGLYLIRKICDNYDWTIQETGVPGKGAQFTMTIPKINNKRETLYAIS